MLRHIGLAAVAVALVTLTAETVHGRGGMRGHSSFRYYNSGSGGFSAGNWNSTGGATVTSHYRGSSGTSSRKSSNSASNSLSSEETSSTSTSTGAIANVTKRGAGAFGSNTSTTQQTTTTPATSTPATTSTQTQPLVANTPLGLTPSLGIPLSQDPNTSADRSYRGLLRNAKELIKAGVYPPAITDLQRIINGAPGTRIATEAQRLLARIPTN